MKKQNLILTSTVGMPREAWLEFRQPLTHIKKFVVDTWNEALKPTPLPYTQEQFFGDQPTAYAGLQMVFHSQAWKDFIFPCLGASEVSTVLGLNPYKSSIELYFEKIGAKPVFDIDNAAMFWGRELEEQIAQKWQYWDGSAEGMIANFAAGDIKRKCRRMNAYVQNKDFPWLFVSLDRVINKQRTGGIEVIEEGSLEAKTISGFAADMWASGIPVMYVAQLQTQLLVFVFEFGEIAILKDGRYFEVYPFDKHDAICQRILDDSKKFFDIVKEGAMNYLLHSYATNDEDKQQYYANLERIAPEPDGSESYKAYLSEKYSSDTGEGITGGIVELELAKEYKYFAARIKDFDVLQTERSNKLKAFMKDNGKLDFGADGNCTWKNNTKGTRTFRVNVTNEPGYVPEAFKPQPWPLEEVNTVATAAIDLPKEEQEPAPAVEIPFTGNGTKPARKKKIVEESERGE